jgi:hypothetical protein
MSVGTVGVPVYALVPGADMLPEFSGTARVPSRAYRW